MKKVIGVDVGNYDTKTAHTTIPSGYVTSKTLPPETDEYILYKGTYYIPTQKRFPYRMDKTRDERGLILTLFGISKEVLFSLGNVATNIQKDLVVDFNELALGVGLPPAHFSTLKTKTHDYYMAHLKDGISYEYNGIPFSFKLTDFYVFAQDYAAVIADEAGFALLEKYSEGIVYAIDIGGMTVDYVPIIKRRPDMANADSIEYGMNKMYDMIIQRTMMEFGHAITPTNIEQVLLQKENVIPQEGRDLIEANAERWAVSIVDALREKGMDLWANPGVFMGGGSILLHRFLKNTGMVDNSVFLNSVNVNASAYTYGMRNYLK